MTTIQELTPIAKNFNQQTNEVNEIIASVNAKLDKLNLGITVAGGLWLQNGRWQETLDATGDEYARRVRSVHYLGYAKVDGKWQLAVATEDESQDYNRTSGRFEAESEYDEPVFSSLLQASRSLRVKALEGIPMLISCLKLEAQKQLRVIEEAKAFACNL